MNVAVVAVFGIVYLGMIAGRLPRLRIDRTGVALLGAIAMLALGARTTAEAWRAIDVSTIALLLALMIVSAQLRLGGFYGRVADRIAHGEVPPARLLLRLVLAAGGLAAIFSNDVVCLAVAPVVIDACARRRLDPIPFLVALACAANVGSAATLIGNPQNMLIGQELGLSFGGYLLVAGPIALAGLLATWGAVVLLQRGRWHASEPIAEARDQSDERGPFDRWQTFKGLVVAAALVVAFLAAPWPREIVALTGAGVLLLSRRLHARDVMGLVDWPLLVLFVGLFVVNDAFAATGWPTRAVAALAGAGVDPAQPGWLFLLATILSNLVSNVPAVMLLLPVAADPHAGAILAVVSTLAGNLLLVGSIANLIVIEIAARRGVVIGWSRHARYGVPVALATLAIAAIGLALAAPLA